MNWTFPNYLPLAPIFFSMLVGLLVLLLILIQLGVLHFAYKQLGVTSNVALLLLFGSLVGSYFNIPLAELPQRRILSGQEINFFGMRYMVPVVVQWPGTLVAVNVGGAVIPTLMSVYLLIKHRLWLQAALATAAVTVVCYWLARPIPGFGIAIPIFAPVAATAIASILISAQRPAPLAYISGSLGTLIGADLLNFREFQNLGAPIASIGGAGTFDGIFITGILAVLIASISRGSDSPHSRVR